MMRTMFCVFKSQLLDASRAANVQFIGFYKSTMSSSVKSWHPVESCNTPKRRRHSQFGHCVKMALFWELILLLTIILTNINYLWVNNMKLIFIINCFNLKITKKATDYLSGSNNPVHYKIKACFMAKKLVILSSVAGHMTWETQSSNQCQKKRGEEETRRWRRGNNLFTGGSSTGANQILPCRPAHRCHFQPVRPVQRSQLGPERQRQREGVRVNPPINKDIDDLELKSDEMRP